MYRKFDFMKDTKSEIRIESEIYLFQNRTLIRVQVSFKDLILQKTQRGVGCEVLTVNIEFYTCWCRSQCVKRIKRPSSLLFFPLGIG